ncbi:asparaginase [bacterium]|nr:asparaginase [bacterium]
MNNRTGLSPLVRAYRNDVCETVHCGALAVCDPQGKLLASVGDPDFTCYVRSSGKPFQALAVLESGAADRFAYSDEEIAITAASHSGEPEHQELVSGILARIGLGPEHLQCGLAWPMYQPRMFEYIKEGREKSTLCHNCSGKHAGMLAACVHRGYPIATYRDPAHPHQQHILRAFAGICDYPVDAVKIGVDGCGVPVHALPLRNTATGIARFVLPSGQPPERAEAALRIARAMTAHPFLVSGPERTETQIFPHLHGKAFGKSGAEGYYVMGIHAHATRFGPLGVAVKIGDGNALRCICPVLIELLAQLGALSDDELAALRDQHYKPVLNGHGERVGVVRPEFTLEWK